RCTDLAVGTGMNPDHIIAVSGRYPDFVGSDEMIILFQYPLDLDVAIIDQRTVAGSVDSFFWGNGLWRKERRYNGVSSSDHD
ncbi:hypothetical protein, partial [Pseudomonas sp. SIMBA_068]|uniref:hypothetical protein n=1 Tax=Pseudomonas sp. SIMBA_068 TaxID=3085808 RepID=UPI00397C824B